MSAAVVVGGGRVEVFQEHYRYCLVGCVSPYFGCWSTSDLAVGYVCSSVAVGAFGLPEIFPSAASALAPGALRGSKGLPQSPPRRTPQL
ncbi:hypothetical protein RHGRI_010570 [Rhododendron griersonianum]|uniref:Uncharacterized protein n=1 Tax=Rhododendron griersonianum TaxID=479676 RepID=A0AAV6KJ32_9ERIC|nr:hypothetical protein RHGRI_010570 [Rhododendron griersonianum]